MNEILRKYLFHFLRSPDYVTDVNFYLPKFLTNDSVFSETQRVLSWEHEQYRLKIIDFAKQFQAQTATWGLSVWEEELGLPTDLSIDLELRRKKVLAKLLGTSPMTVANTNRLINLFTNDGKGYVEELPKPGTLKIILPSEKVFIEELRDALDEMLPAHLAYNFQHKVEIISDAEEESFADINDEIFNMVIACVQFPIVENVPFGKEIKIPKYNGKVLAKANQFDGENIFSGAIKFDLISDKTSKVGGNLKYWLAKTGESFFNKEFRHDGAIKFDGLKPQEIIYDDGFDELNFQVENNFEENILSAAKFNGENKFDGNLSEDKNGDLELRQFKNFDGAAKFDGGDLNYFNGTIKADGKFNFNSGDRAEIEILTDKLDGRLSNVGQEKETPPIYPEVFDFVPKTTEKISAEMTLKSFAEEVEKPTENYPVAIISKAVRYDGAKNYTGGNLKYFDGSIKANGKFNFESEGNQAKVEVLAVDLDGKFSLQRTAREKPSFVYVENFDFVGKIFDKNYLSAEISAEEEINSEDVGGALKIIRRVRFDGNLNYRGRFEQALRKFDGGLNYNNIFRVKLGGENKFDGLERYGGQKNSSTVEYFDDIDGSFEVEKPRQLPIATRDKLGFVIIGGNLNIDAGKIILPQRFKPQILSEMPSGKLKNIFESWRRKNEV